MSSAFFHITLHTGDATLGVVRNVLIPFGPCAGEAESAHDAREEPDADAWPRTIVGSDEKDEKNVAEIAKIMCKDLPPFPVSKTQ